MISRAGIISFSFLIVMIPALSLQASFQPTLDLTGGLDDVIQILVSRDVRTLKELVKQTTMDRFLCDAARARCFRYLYSPKWGWLDLTHFTAGAEYSSRWYLTTDMVLWRGALLENQQERAGNTSSWSYEDLPSNMMGAFFSRYLKKSQSRDLVQSLRAYLLALGFVDDPMIAPNLPQLPPRSHGEPRPPQNHSYTSRYTTQGSDSYNDLDRALARFRDRLNRIRGD